MARTDRLARALTAAFAVVAATALAAGPWGAEPASAQPSGCRVNPPAQRYALTLDDFGRDGEAVVTTVNPDYYNGTGFLWGFQRGDYENVLANPYGSYQFGAVIIADDTAQASSQMMDSVQSWTKEWQTFETVPHPMVGDESVLVRRLTPWEIAQETPMTEVFFAFRRCNGNAHFLFATMTEFDPVAQALRYARIIDARFQS